MTQIKCPAGCVEGWFEDAFGEGDECWWCEGVGTVPAEKGKAAYDEWMAEFDAEIDRQARAAGYIK